MKKLICLLIFAALAIPASAATNPWLGNPILIADLPPCTATSRAQNKEFTVTNCATAADCTTTGTATVRLVCDGTAYRPINYLAGAGIDTSLYVLKTVAGQQSIAATGTGNDVTVTAADAFNANATGIATMTGGSGGAADYSAFQANPTMAQILVESDTQNSSIQVNAAGIDVDSDSYVSIISTTSTTINPTTTFAVDAAGGVDELGVSDKVVSVAATVMLRLVQQATPPAACAAGTEGGLYLDSDTHLLCVCNASAWVQVADGTTGCS